ncbi:izumo sperm-egg fusion protein 4 isoform X1 [Halichoerus grypus]|uniref:izumo sperm-egg fusion protein 4 isoform X6 n=1 Tax=Halichoerus grypus TaxID=9711 RepID=UPI001659FB3C|nr:izumo sperm-egg fusion protein 4 isoform X6 [Halichoerus grypus]
MALLLCLGLTAALARGCLHCHSNFSEKFSFYRHHVNLKSWWVGDIPVSGSLLTDWSQDTMKELHLAIPAEITQEKLDQVANAVYRKMDQLYQGKMYFPGYFPNELRAIFREQVHLIQNAIIESRIDCQRHCGIFQYETVSCTNCTDSHVVCFGYNCESSAQWETAVRGLLLYINKWHKYVSFIRGSECAREPLWTGHEHKNHSSLSDITKLHVSGAPTPGQPDSGKRFRVLDTALTATRFARPALARRWSQDSAGLSQPDPTEQACCCLESLHSHQSLGPPGGVCGFAGQGHRAIRCND